MKHRERASWRQGGWRINPSANMKSNFDDYAHNDNGSSHRTRNDDGGGHGHCRIAPKDFELLAPTNLIYAVKMLTEDMSLAKKRV